MIKNDYQQVAQAFANHCKKNYGYPNAMVKYSFSVGNCLIVKIVDKLECTGYTVKIKNPQEYGVDKSFKHICSTFSGIPVFSLI